MQPSWDKTQAYLGRAAAFLKLGNASAALSDTSVLIDGRDASPLIDSRSTVERMFLSDAELSQTLIRRAWLHYELKRDELAASDILRAVELGGRRQILKLQLLLKRNGMTVTIDGEKSEQLSDRVKDCFAETACREGLSTPL